MQIRKRFEVDGGGLCDVVAVGYDMRRHPIVLRRDGGSVVLQRFAQQTVRSNGDFVASCAAAVDREFLRQIETTGERKRTGEHTSRAYSQEYRLVHSSARISSQNCACSSTCSC